MKKLLVFFCVGSSLYGGSCSSRGTDSPRVRVQIFIDTSAVNIVKELVEKKTVEEGVQLLEAHSKQLTDDVVREIVAFAAQEKQPMLVIAPVMWYLMKNERREVLVPVYNVRCVESVYFDRVEYNSVIPESMRPFIERAMKSFFDDKFDRVTKS